MLGSKIDNLKLLKKHNISVPNFFVIEGEDVLNINYSSFNDVESIKKYILDNIKIKYKNTLNTKLYSVRSSCNLEDSESDSFAGQFDTYLNVTEEELDEIIRVSRETGKTFHEMAGSVFTQPFWALRKLVMSGQLGEVVQVYTQKSYPLKIQQRPQNEDIDGGLILQVGVHNLRFIEHITGIKIDQIYAVQTKVGNPCIEGNLHTGVSYMMVLENGGVASAVTNYMNFPRGFGKYGNECVRIFGTKGYAEIMDGGRKSRVIIDDEYRGELDISEKPKSFLTCYVDSLLNRGEMPFDLETELHPTRMAIKAKMKGLEE